MPPVRLRRPSGATVLAVVGGLAGLALAIALFIRLGPDSTTSAQLRGFQVRSDTAVQIEVEVARTPGSAVTCVVRARDVEGVEVGRAELPVPPSKDRTTVFAPVLPTTARAVSGELVGCRAGTVGPPP